MSAHSVRIYVPLEQHTRRRRVSPSRDSRVSSWMVTGRGWRSTCLPFRARSHSFWPLTFRAEYMGGICMISPRKRSSTAVSCPGVTLTSRRKSTVPVVSSVSVATPRSSSVS